MYVLLRDIVLLDFEQAERGKLSDRASGDIIVTAKVLTIKKNV
ncbi:MAG: hypothetical protein AAGA60_16800 [Cyanobacteria bacterium P01_E01_bin.42]